MAKKFASKPKPKKRTPRRPNVVQVVKGKELTYLTFFCRCCYEPHTIVVRSPKSTIPLNFRGTYFKWNGLIAAPTISDGEGCIHNEGCHVWIRDGKIMWRCDYVPIDRHSPGFNPMLPVKQWPRPRPFPKRKRIVNVHELEGEL